MSNLEEAARDLLVPFFESNRPIRLGVDDLTLLTTWATKSWMAYALTLSSQANPFSESEYRHIAAHRSPIGRRSQVWLMHSNEDGAHVGMGLEPTLFSRDGPPQNLEVTNNSGFGYLSASTLVMFMALLPPHASDEMATRVFAPPITRDGTVRRIWPDPRRQYFPLGALPMGALRTLLRFPTEFVDTMGLPTEGVTDDDLPAVLQRFRDGESPKQLRREFRGDR